MLSYNLLCHSSSSLGNEINKVTHESKGTTKDFCIQQSNPSKEQSLLVIIIHQKLPNQTEHLDSDSKTAALVSFIVLKINLTKQKQRPQT